MEPMKFRKKPVDIEAVQLTPESAEGILSWITECLGEAKAYVHPNGEVDILIWTLEGEMRATQKDWIIRGIQGEFYPCKPDIFAESYELV